LKYGLTAVSIVLAMAAVHPAAAQTGATREQIVQCDVEGKGASAVSIASGIAACSALIADPNFPVGAKVLAYSRRGMFYSEQQRYDQAVSDLDRAIALDAFRPVLWLLRGSVLVAKGDFEEGLMSLDRGAAHAPNDPVVRAKRATALIGLSKPVEALAEAEASLAIDPDNFEARIVKAQSLGARGDYAAAESLFAGLIAQSPEPYVYIRRAAFYMGSGQYGKGVADYDQVVKAAPDNSISYYARGWGLLKMGDSVNAFADFDRAARGDPTRAVYFYGRGLAASQLGHKADGEADIAKAMTMDRDVTAHFVAVAW